MAHEILIDITQDVVAGGLVPAEVELAAAEDVDEPCELLDHFVALADLRLVVEVDILEHTSEHLVVLRERGEGYVDLLADVMLVPEFLEVLEGAALGNNDGGVFHTRVTVGDVLHENERQHVVLVLAGVHAAAKLVAEAVQRIVQIVLPDCHGFVPFTCLA